MDMIETERLRLRHWRDNHFDAFATMQADPQVMADQGGPADEARSRALPAGRLKIPMACFSVMPASCRACPKTIRSARTTKSAGVS